MDTTYLDELAELQADAEAAYRAAAEASSNAAGIAALLRQRHQLAIAMREERNRLEALEAAERNRERTEAELIAETVAELADLPPAALDAIIEGLVDAGRARDIRRVLPAELHVVRG